MVSSNKINVLITGVGGGGHGRQVLKALRIAKTPYYIVGTDMSPISMGLYEVDKAYLVSRANDSAYIPRILEICEKERIQVLITGSEPELLEISEHRSKFEERRILLPINPDQVLGICMDKWQTYNFLVENGFYCPNSFLIEDESDLTKVRNLPVVIKPTIASGGSLNVFIAQDRGELTAFVRYVKKQGLRPMVQEYIGSYNEEYTVGVLTDIDDGSLIGSIAVKRQILSGLSNRMRIKNRHLGKVESDLLVISSGISQGEVNDFPEVRKCCEEVALKLGAKGPINIQCRKEKDRVYIFEINPRFSGTTFVRALVGYNEPDILIRKHILGEKISEIKYKKGIVVRGLQELYIPFDKALETNS